MEKKIETIDCTPTWAWSASVYLLVLRSNKPGSEGYKNASEGIMEMAQVIDRINKKGLLKEGTTQEDLNKD